jgi:hypothetical protein
VRICAGSLVAVACLYTKKLHAIYRDSSLVLGVVIARPLFYRVSVRTHIFVERRLGGNSTHRSKIDTGVCPVCSAARCARSAILAPAHASKLSILPANNEAHPERISCYYLGSYLTSTNHEQCGRLRHQG